jgi:hypothetical protein
VGERIELHGRFAVRVDGRSVERSLPGRVLQHVSVTHPELAENVTPGVVRGWIELVP